MWRSADKIEHKGKDLGSNRLIVLAFPSDWHGRRIIFGFFLRSELVDEHGEMYNWSLSTVRESEYRCARTFFGTSLAFVAMRTESGRDLDEDDEPFCLEIRRSSDTKGRDDLGPFGEKRWCSRRRELRFFPRERCTTFRGIRNSDSLHSGRQGRSKRSGKAFGRGKWARVVRRSQSSSIFLGDVFDKGPALLLREEEGVRLCSSSVLHDVLTKTSASGDLLERRKIFLSRRFCGEGSGTDRDAMDTYLVGS